MHAILYAQKGKYIESANLDANPRPIYTYKIVDGIARTRQIT